MKPARYDHDDPKGQYFEGDYKYDMDGDKIYVPTKPEITCIPQTSEKFMTFSVGDIKFIDSFKFMATSLDKLVKNLYDKTDPSDQFSGTHTRSDKYKHFNFMKKRIP